MPARAVLQRHAGAIGRSRNAWEAGLFGLQWNWLDLVLLIFIVALAYLPPLRKYSHGLPGLSAPFDPGRTYQAYCRGFDVEVDPGRPYQAYCRDFDLEVEADKLDAVLAAVPPTGGDWSRRFPDHAARLPDVEKDLAARSASRDSAVRETAARIRAVASQDVLDDSIVSLLIDHSGSMRGTPMLFAARAAMTASDLLDELGCKQEILGFTTVRWKGGLSREKWVRDGKPPYPGRLNDLLHIVYCSAGERLDARHCAAMQRKDLLKENIDGEAIEWAASRLRQRREKHKYLIVVSDGAPVDDSTLSVNAGNYLERHLFSVIYGIAEASDIQLAAIGIGHPVERYYLHSATVTAPEELDGAVLQMLEKRLGPPPADSPYQVYCRDFDVEVEADRLDAVLGLHRNSISAARLANVEKDIAARRLTQAPAVRETAARIRAATSQGMLEDTIVSLLIDHSGSMRGTPMLFAARAAMTASDLLDGLGVRQEVLGFTTARWKGGLSREKWLREGQPRHPGRLNDLLHIVYCSAGERFQVRHYATMLREELLKENIDGEALEWATSRLRQRAESHKYLIVVSDGAPVDDSTMVENGERYLRYHLHGVIGSIERTGEIQLAAVGINHPVERYYARSMTVTAPEELEGAVLQLIERLLGAPPSTVPPAA
jgi:cobaltochelatase CobT